MSEGGGGGGGAGVEVGGVEGGEGGGFVVLKGVENSIDSHEKVDIICRVGREMAEGEGFGLRYKADNIYIFPSVKYEVDAIYWYYRCPPLTEAVAVDGGSPFVSLLEGNGHQVEFVTGQSERLHLFLPGRRYGNEELSLRGTYTDRFRNVGPGGLVDMDIELFLEKEGERIALGGPDGQFKAGHRIEIPLGKLKGGVYRAVACRRGSDEVIARSNPLEIVDEGGGMERIYWGEIHGHTEMSDGCGEYGELYRHARYEGCLDFAAAADHACYFSDNEWQWMQDIINSWNEGGEFVTLVGYEWAGRQVHRNIYTSRDRLDLFRGMYEATSNLDVVWKHFHGDEEVVGGPHAPMAHGVSWEYHDADVERFVEIYSMWGASDDRESALKPVVAAQNNHQTAAELIATGAKLGFTGGGDCHEGHVGFSCEDVDGQGTRPHTFAKPLVYRCGMTAAVMGGLDRRSLIKALRNRKTYATTGARILLDFSVGGVAMGDVGKVKEVECRATVHGVEIIEKIEVIKDGESVWEVEVNSLDGEITWTDGDAGDGEHFYYLRVVQSDGEMAWSSPVWVEKIVGAK